MILEKNLIVLNQEESQLEDEGVTTGGEEEVTTGGEEVTTGGEEGTVPGTEGGDEDEGKEGADEM